MTLLDAEERAHVIADAWERGVVETLTPAESAGWNDNFLGRSAPRGPGAAGWLAREIVFGGREVEPERRLR